MEDELKKYYNYSVKLASEAISDAMQKRIDKNILISICLALKIRNSCSSIVHLLDLGFVHDSRIILRSCAEALIILHEAIQNKNVWDNIQADEYERVKVLLNKQIEYQLVLNKSPYSEMCKTLEKVKSKYTELKKKQFDIKELAAKHNCLSEYYFYAATANGYVHNTPNVLSKYFKYNREEDVVEEFINLPNCEDQYIIADIAISMLYKVTLLFSQFYDTNKIGHLNTLHKEYQIFINPIFSKFVEDNKGQ
jgi:hypothetical protein